MSKYVISNNIKKDKYSHSSQTAQEIGIVVPVALP